MSEGGHHHGGDMAGQQGVQPGMFPPHEHHHQHQHVADPTDPFYIPSAYVRPRSRMRRYRPPAGSPAWFGLWAARLAILAFIGYVAFEIVHGAATSTPTP